MKNWPLKLCGAVLMLSALSVVYCSFANRELAHEWQKLGQTHTQLQEEYGRLMLEYSTLAAPSRIEVMARKELHMVFPSKDNTRVIQLNDF
jgi:cell division protein FtsL